METIFDAAGGAAGLLDLAEAWHERVMADAVVSQGATDAPALLTRTER